MQLPVELQRAIEAAHTAMIADPEHLLLPIFRQQIYQAVEDLSGSRYNQIRGWLAFVTAQHVRSIWYQERSDDPMLDQVLDVTEGVLRNTVGKEAAQIQVYEEWQWEETLVKLWKQGISVKAWCAGEAASTALRDVTGYDPCATKVADAKLTDEWLDPGESDTPKWAVAAYAGRNGEATSDPMRRKEFWQWWLWGAVPAAWEAGQ
jgi:hypothetical protein